MIKLKKGCLIYLGYYPFGILFIFYLFFEFSIWVRYQSYFTFARDQSTADDDVRVFLATTFTHLSIFSSRDFYPNTIFLPDSIINIFIFHSTFTFVPDRLLVNYWECDSNMSISSFGILFKILFLLLFPDASYYSLFCHALFG